MSSGEGALDDARSLPGPILRRAREQIGLTDQQAAEQLNLDVNIVTALESDDYPALGAPVFVKGHLRRYAALLGLDAAELLEAYAHSSGHLQQPSLIPRARIEMTPERTRPRWPWIVGGTAAVVVAAGIAAYVSEYGFSWPGRALMPAGLTPEGSDAAEPGAPIETASAAQAAADGTAPIVTSVSGDPVPGGDAAPPVPSGHVSIGLSFGVDSWVEIYDGSGQAVLYDLGRAGTQRTIAAAAPLSVTLGNATGVKLVVNGRETALPPLPPGQSVARLTVEPDGSLR